MNLTKRQLPARDWTFTVILTVLVILALALAMCDPSWHYRSPPPDAIPTR
jgi:hypothetical protein